LARISEMANLMPIRSSSGFSRLFENSTADVIQPTVIEASQAAVFDPTVTEIGSSVGTMEPEQSWTSLIITE
jgi:hypothetical protein